MCYVFILIMELTIFFIILKYVIFSRVMISLLKKIEKVEVCDGLYNYLLFATKFIIFQSLSHIQNDVFHDKYLIKMFNFFKNKALLTWRWKKMWTVTSFQLHFWYTIMLNHHGNINIKVGRLFGVTKANHNFSLEDLYIY